MYCLYWSSVLQSVFRPSEARNQIPTSGCINSLTRPFPFFIVSNCSLSISTPSTRKGFHAQNMASHGRMFIILSSFIKFCFKKPNFCVQAMSEQYSNVYCCCFSVRGEHAQKQIFGDFFQ